MATNDLSANGKTVLWTAIASPIPVVMDLLAINELFSDYHINNMNSLTRYALISCYCLRILLSIPVIIKIFHKDRLNKKGLFDKDFDDMQCIIVLWLILWLILNFALMAGFIEYGYKCNADRFSDDEKNAMTELDMSIRTKLNVDGLVWGSFFCSNWRIHWCLQYHNIY